MFAHANLNEFMYAPYNQYRIFGGSTKGELIMWDLQNNCKVILALKEARNKNSFIISICKLDSEHDDHHSIICGSITGYIFKVNFTKNIFATAKQQQSSLHMYTATIAHKVSYDTFGSTQSLFTVPVLVEKNSSHKQSPLQFLFSAHEAAHIICHDPKTMLSIRILSLATNLSTKLYSCCYLPQ